MLRDAEAVTRDRPGLAGPLTHGHPDHVKRLTLVMCILASGIAFLAATAVSLALPAVTRDFGGGLTSQSVTTTSGRW